MQGANGKPRPSSRCASLEEYCGSTSIGSCSTSVSAVALLHSVIYLVGYSYAVITFFLAKTVRQLDHSLPSNARGQTTIQHSFSRGVHLLLASATWSAKVKQQVIVSAPHSWFVFLNGFYSGVISRKCERR